MRTKLQGFLIGLILFSATVPLVAHHSFAVDYDIKKPVKLQGVVTMIQWTNPHAHVYLDVVENGVKTNWNFEMASPNILERNGWSRKALNVNDQVTVVGLYYNPAPAAFSNRLLNVDSQWSGGLMAWNVHDWDLIGASSLGS